MAMSETWDDYSTTDLSNAADAVADVSPVASTELDSAAVAQDWSNWNAESAGDWSESAASSDYAGDLALSQGDLEGAQYNYEHADSYADTASDYATTASDYQSTTDSYVDTAADTYSYDTSGADTSSYDTGGDVDTGDITSVL